jgi:hypothetical protein
MDGVKQNSGAKRPVLHFIVRFPPELLSGPSAGPFSGTKSCPVHSGHARGCCGLRGSPRHGRDW